MGKRANTPENQIWALQRMVRELQKRVAALEKRTGKKRKKQKGDDIEVPTDLIRGFAGAACRPVIRAMCHCAMSGDEDMSLPCPECSR